jgi:hypothetical protein
MIDRQSTLLSTVKRAMRADLDHKLAAYFAASTSAGALLASQAEAAVVSSTAVQPFGINEAVPIDFNSDGQVDFEIDHDRVDLGGGNLVDYLQLDKNDLNGASPGEDLLPVDWAVNFELNGTVANDNGDFAYVTTTTGVLGEYPAALGLGTPIGPDSPFDFQEGDNFNSTMRTIRANRLIDEDAGQVDMTIGGLTSDQIEIPTNGPNFLGLGEEAGYLGVKMDLNGTGDINYGWIGVRITNEADATGEVVGWGYQTDAGAAILAGETAPGITGDYNGNGAVDAADYTIWRDNLGLTGGATPSQGDGTGDGNVTQEDYNVWKSNFSGTGSGAGQGIALGATSVPEPSSLLLGLLAGTAMIGVFVYRRIFGR